MFLSCKYITVTVIVFVICFCLFHPWSAPILRRSDICEDINYVVRLQGEQLRRAQDELLSIEESSKKGLYKNSGSSPKIFNEYYKLFKKQVDSSKPIEGDFWLSQNYGRVS